jgi:isopentenyl-diphosphate Delta-isomerase
MLSTIVHGPNMLIDQVDDRDEPIGSIGRSEVFRLKANFRVSHVLIFDKSGRLLIQRLAATRDRHALLWGSSVASYVPSGSTYVEAARDRVLQELGIIDVSLKQFAKTTMIDNGCTKFIRVFEAVYEGKLRIDHSHIAETRFVTLQNLFELPSGGDAFTPTFCHIVNALLDRR